MKTTLYIWMLLLGLTPLHSMAATDHFNFEGVLTQADGITPITASTPVKFQILNPAGTCVLYEETQTFTPELDGSFSRKIGTAPGDGLRGGADVNNSMSTVFGMTPSIAGKLASDGVTNCNYTPSNEDGRKLRVTVNTNVLNPDYELSAVPMAKVAETAEDANRVGGIPAANILQSDAGNNVTQANLAGLFNHAQYGTLSGLMAGTDSRYLSSSAATAVSMNSQRIINVGAPTAGTDAVNRNYADATLAGRTADSAVLSALSVGDTGKVMSWDGANSRWTAVTPSAVDASKLPLAGGTMTGLIDMASNNIENAGHITMSAGRTLHLGVYSSGTEPGLISSLGTGDAGKIWYNNSSNDFKLWNGGAAITVGAIGGIAAGGDLSGTYPNPSIAAGAITSAKINDGSITASKLAASSVTASNISAGAILSTHINSGAIQTNALFSNPGQNYLVMTDGTTGSSLASKSCGLGQILEWTVTGWDCASDDTGAGGTVTSIAAGTGLTGGPITGAGTISIAAGGVNTPEISNFAITAPKINNDAVTSAAIMDGNIASVDIANNAITATQLNSDAVTTTKILDGTITSADIAANTITSADLANNSVGSTTIIDATIANADLAANAVTDGKINDMNVGKISSSLGTYFTYKPNNLACANGQFLTWDNTNMRWSCGSAGGGSVTAIYTDSSLTGGGITTTGTIGINAGGVLSSHILDGTITNADLASSSVNSSSIVDNSITTADIGGGAVTDAKINDMNVSKILSSGGSYFTYMPNGIACGGGQSLVWQSGPMRWECQTVGDFRSDGSMPMTGQLRAQSGSVALPGISFDGDSDTGISRPLNDTLVVSTAGTERIRIANNGSIGIGTASPLYPLDVTANSNVTATQVSPAANFTQNPLPSGASSATFTGIIGSTEINSGSGFLNSAQIMGIQGFATINSTDSLSSMTGVSGESYHYGTATISSARGVAGKVGIYSGTIINAKAGDFSVSSSGGTINNGYGVYIGNILGTSNRWGLYSSDNTAKNFFAGNVGIGTTAATAPLEVKGSVKFSGTTSGGVILQAASSGSSGVYTLPMVDGSAGNLLATNGAGQLSWVPKPIEGENTYPTGNSVDFSNAKIVIMQSIGGSNISLSGIGTPGEYTLIIQDTTSRTYTFSGGPCIANYFSPAAGATSGQTIFKIVTVPSQNKCYINWTTGY